MKVYLSFKYSSLLKTYFPLLTSHFRSNTPLGGFSVRLEDITSEISISGSKNFRAVYQSMSNQETKTTQY